MDNNNTLQYKDERDRSYGLTGMAVAMYIWDGEEYLVALDMESAPGQGLHLSPAFNMYRNPRMSARLVWQDMLKQFELSTAILLGNAMCRSYCGGGSGRLSSAATAMIRALVRDEGREICSLDDDEINTVYDKTYRYLDQLFTHSRVVETVHELAAALLTHRTLTAAEAIDRLRALR